MTTRQKMAFWTLFAKACKEKGLNERSLQEEWRHSVFIEETGKEHLADMNNTSDYEAIMRRLANEAGEYALAVEYCGQAEKRLIAVIKDEARQILVVEGRRSTVEGQRSKVEGRRSTVEGQRSKVEGLDLAAEEEAYITGILRKSGLWRGYGSRPEGTDWIWDYPVETHRKVMQILDSHRRRLFKRYGIEPVKYQYGFKITHTALVGFC